MQTFSFFDTPVVLQASLGHLIVPFVVAFVLTGPPASYRKFSNNALIGSALIAVVSTIPKSFLSCPAIQGCLGHISVSYLSNPSNEIDQIFWHAIFLLSTIPLAISSLSQQQTYSIRRLNVFHFLFHATLFQLLSEIILLPLNCIKGMSSLTFTF